LIRFVRLTHGSRRGLFSSVAPRLVQSRARGKRRKLFPIALTDNATLKKWERLDSATGEALAAAVRKHHLPDFSNWQSPRRLCPRLRPASFAQSLGKRRFLGWSWPVVAI